MKTQVICTKCNSSTVWIWGNQVGRCDSCETVLDVSEVRLSKKATEKVLPAA